MLKEIRKCKDEIHTKLYYAKMSLSSHKFANEYASKPFRYELAHKEEVMINDGTGFPIEYQHNKVFNLKLASKKIDKLIIKANEVFSFWYCLKDAQKEESYKDGLCIINGEMAYVPGGGLCQLSNILFYLFLNGPFKIIERHGHDVREFDDPNAHIKGIDATVAEGYLDLKVKNISDQDIQINIDFTDTAIKASISSDHKLDHAYQIINKNLNYPLLDNEQFEIVDIYRQELDGSKLVREEKLYTNVTKILYEI